MPKINDGVQLVKTYVPTRLEELEEKYSHSQDKGMLAKLFFMFEKWPTDPVVVDLKKRWDNRKEMASTTRSDTVMFTHRRFDELMKTIPAPRWYEI